uniref:Tektin n=1 Tax=Erpetoichthys calabaricus TaxID=27687 RepID=A0A8C4XH05_ERPCA
MCIQDLNCNKPCPEVALNTGLYSSAGQATAGYRSAKYTTNEWHQGNYSSYFAALTDLENAEVLRRESKKLTSETRASTQTAQANATRMLGERLQELHAWKSELQRLIEALTAETDLLLAQKRRLESALNATETPQLIATDNLQCRERRVGSDLVKDDVEVELLKALAPLTPNWNKQVANRAIKSTLEMDWSDKYEAYSIDDKCGRHNSKCTETQRHPSSVKFQDSLSTPETWNKFTEDNIKLGENEQMVSANLRALIDKVLQDTAEDLRAQCADVDKAFAKRCEEMSDAKFRLEHHLNQILEQISAQEKNIVELQQAIRDKEAPLKVAETRLYRRSFRPNMELCRDPVQFRLVSEVGEITESIESLQKKLEEAKQSLSSMEDTRMALEKEIGNKKNSLFIDRDKCMTHRTRYPPVNRLLGY